MSTDSSKTPMLTWQIPAVTPLWEKDFESIYLELLGCQIRIVTSAKYTTRVIEAGAGQVAVCEGWRRGAEIGQMDDPDTLGPKIREMIGKVRKNSGMDGLELD